MEIYHGLNSPVILKPATRGRLTAVFLFFIFVFLQKYIFRVRNLHEYTPTTPLPAGRNLAARQPGGRGLSVKKLDKKLHRGPCRTSRPAAGRRALAARLRGDRPPDPI